jgi:hypothetical protein
MNLCVRVSSCDFCIGTVPPVWYFFSHSIVGHMQSGDPMSWKLNYMINMGYGPCRSIGLLIANKADFVFVYGKS